MKLRCESSAEAEAAMSSSEALSTLACAATWISSASESSAACRSARRHR
eukprot:CAMPEP_0205884956 /NCGR_PEP_ID=MMETSP1083-20121108/18401_1 /ASSEMBLY_ACC=CAM_ASM_000430 /TAXON_ID=97485 /ORGANISM="Prymnesium parvum, Strain Texoma1" /LENGTH=48 /DNA_ID=CAMNT_0053248405 /DNA_START=493 /DNA_END=636 /DNA_ORIENTATION=+